MMKAVADFTRDYQVKTIVSVNPIMVDATGMCGACRCTVGGKTVFGCVDGPDFELEDLIPYHDEITFHQSSTFSLIIKLLFPEIISNK